MPSEGHASPQQTAAEERAKGNGRLYVKTQKLAFFGRIKHPESLEKGELEAKEKKAERQTTRLTITRWRPKCFRKGYESAIISYRSHSKTHRKLLFRTFCQAKRTPQVRYRKINFREDAAISSPHEPATRMNTAQKPLRDRDRAQRMLRIDAMSAKRARCPAEPPIRGTHR